MRTLGPCCAALALTIASVSPAFARPPTPFEEAVNDAIERAVAYLILRQEEDGGWDDGHRGEGVGLPMLCILEQPLSVHRPDFHRGYRRLLPEARAAVEAAAAFLPTRDEALTTSRRAHSNRTGLNLMALSTYLATGGPADIGLELSAREMVANGWRALHRIQGRTGGWRYIAYDGHGDVSCAQWASAGLAAAAQLDPEADDVLPGLLEWIEETRSPNGAPSYEGGDGSPLPGDEPNIRGSCDIFVGAGPLNDSRRVA